MRISPLLRLGYISCYFNAMWKECEYWSQIHLCSNLGSAMNYYVTNHLAFPGLRFFKHPLTVRILNLFVG